MIIAKILLKRDSKVFSCDYWEIFKSTFFEEYLRTVAPSSPDNT